MSAVRAPQRDRRDVAYQGLSLPWVSHQTCDIARTAIGRSDTVGLTRGVGDATDRDAIEIFVFYIIELSSPVCLVRRIQAASAELWLSRFSKNVLVFLLSFSLRFMPS